MLDGLTEFPTCSAVHDALAARFGSAILESSVRQGRAVRPDHKPRAFFPAVDFLKSERGSTP